MKLNIAHLIDAQGGGALTNVITIAKEMLREQVSIQIIFFIPGPGRKVADDLGIPVVVIKKNMSFDVTLIWRLYRYIKNNRIDIMHTHTLNSNFYGRIAAALAGIPVITTVHGYMEELAGISLTPRRNRFFFRIDKLMLRMSSRFIAVTSGIQQRLLQYGVPPEKIEVISNAVYLPSLNNVDITALKKELGIRDSSVVISIVGRTDSVKQHDIFLKSAKEVLKNNSDAQFLVIGDGPLTTKLVQLCNDLDIKDNVIFTGWRNDIELLYQIIDIVVLCSSSEGLPFVILEAMAHQKSVIATSVKEISEVVINGKTGFLVPPGDIDMLAKGIQQLISEPLLRSSLGKEGRLFVEKNFSVKNMVEQVLYLYKNYYESVPESFLQINRR